MKNDVGFEIIKVIKKAYSGIIKQENELVKDYNLTASQYGVLETLYKKGDLCVNDLIEKLGSTSGNMTVIIKNLEKMDLITKISRCEDRRYFNISLTQKGKKLVEKINPDRIKQVNDFANTLSDKEKEIFLELFYKFKKRYKEVKK